ncbi:MAG: cyclase family protein [Bacteroidales bacterium]|nr:cyclase family protein [Bacteroidales bacterium]
MQIFDISQELFSGFVFPGDLAPSRQQVCSISNGDAYNLSNVTMCAHNATHIDAPRHFLQDGKCVDQINLEKCVGEATVVEWNERITSKMVSDLAPNCCKRLLIKGNGIITVEAAHALAEADFLLVGVAQQTVGEGDETPVIHKILLQKEIVILEGLVLKDIQAGNYFLSAAPLKWANCDGSPCRAILCR